MRVTIDKCISLIICNTCFLKFLVFDTFKCLNTVLSKAKKKICGFPVSSHKNLGRVGRF